MSAAADGESSATEQLMREDVIEGAEREEGEEEGDTQVGPFDALDCQINCWACTTRVQVPVVDGALAPEFKCGWCGAITSRRRKKKGGSGHGKGCCGKICGLAERLFNTSFCKGLNWGLSWVTVGIVLFLITSIIALGVWYIIPRLPWRPLHVLLAAVFSVNIYFNYALTVRQSPGSPQEIPGFQSLKLMSSDAHSAHDAVEDEQLGQQAARQQVTRGAFENYTFCRYCEDLKPPQAHHCRVCERCVLEMDHHCPFVNNCVGASNLRHFMLFLFWASSACIYSLSVSVWAVWMYRSALTRPVRINNKHLVVGGFYGVFSSWVVLLLDILGEGIFEKSGRWILAAFYIVCVSTGVAIGVGVLFFMQMQQLLAGVSYIDALKGGAKPNAQSRLHNLQKVFGTGHPLTWLLPRTTLPKGAATLQGVVDLKGE